MSDVQYVTSFRNLNLSDEITGHVELIPGVNITNDASVKSGLLTPELASVAGAIEIEHLRRAPNLVFGELDPEQFGELPPDKVWFPILMWIDGLFRNAWLLKDHAMVCDAAFFRVARSGMSVWSSSFLPIRPSFASGNADREIDMSISELRAWGTKDDLVDGYLHEARSSPFRFMMEKGYARSGRANAIFESSDLKLVSVMANLTQASCTACRAIQAGVVEMNGAPL